MSEIDPWALPRGGVGTAGIPAGPAMPAPVAVRPLNHVLPYVVMALAGVYAIACIVEIFIINSHLSLANQFNSAVSSGGTLTDGQVDQVNASQSHVNTGSWVAGGIYFAALIVFIVWERRLKVDLGSRGARRAVLMKAGYPYFRGTWAISFLLGLFLNSQANQNETTIQDVINHDHELMLYFGLRAVLGVVLVFFAFRLMKISEDGVARLNAAIGR